jgi:hypothetical protein
MGLALALAMAAGPAQALVAYEYEGKEFLSVADADPPAGATYDPGGRVAIRLWFEEAFDPGRTYSDVRGLVRSYVFSDGPHTLTERDSTFAEPLMLSFDGDGALVAWDARVQTPDPGAVGDQQIRITSVFDDSAKIDQGELEECTSVSFGCNGGVDKGLRQNDPGSWTLTPEPSTAALFGLGLLALGCRRTPRS